MPVKKTVLIPAVSKQSSYSALVGVTLGSKSRNSSASRPITQEEGTEDEGGDTMGRKGAARRKPRKLSTAEPLSPTQIHTPTQPHTPTEAHTPTQTHTPTEAHTPTQAHTPTEANTPTQTHTPTQAGPRGEERGPSTDSPVPTPPPAAPVACAQAGVTQPPEPDMPAPTQKSSHTPSSSEEVRAHTPLPEGDQTAAQQEEAQSTEDKRRSVKLPHREKVFIKRVSVSPQSSEDNTDHTSQEQDPKTENGQTSVKL